MKEGFDRLAEFDKVRRNGHSNDCATGIVCHAAPCTCGCIPKWVTNNKMYNRWKFQTRRKTEPMDKEKTLKEVRRQFFAGAPIITVENMDPHTIKELKRQFEKLNHGPAMIVAKEFSMEIFNPPLTVEEMARELHEAGREAVEAGATVAAGTFGEKARKFLEWDEITEEAREGRRIQARYFQRNFIVSPRNS